MGAQRKDGALTVDGAVNLDSYPTLCAVCGFYGRKKLRPKRAARDSFLCPRCGWSLRHRDLAQLVLDEFSVGEKSLTAFGRTPEFEALSIYEPGIRGPFVQAFGGRPNFTNSYFWEDVTPGTIRDGVRCENLCELTFPSESFDLILSVDVFEHVLDAERAFRQIARVLKPGGVHIFSVPMGDPLPKRSRTRAVLEDGEVRHLHAPRYHTAGNDERSLVVTDFGADIVDKHTRAGLRLSVIRRSAPNSAQSACMSLVARRIG